MEGPLYCEADGRAREEGLCTDDRERF